MEKETKYPGADTSKERLVIIADHWNMRGWYSKSTGRDIFDLLAMIEERDARISQQEGEITELAKIVKATYT